IIYAHFDCNQTVFSYEIFFHEINTQNISTLLDDNDIEITSFPLLHSIPTVGFRFQEKDRDLNIRPEAIQKYNFDIETIKRIKKGDDVTLNDHTVIANSELTLAPFRKRSFAYCSDTAFFPEIVEHIREVDILYHEATFSHIDEENAKVAMHSTTTQAATIAKKASVKLLLIGHFSSRYFDFQSLLKEARSQFDDTILAEEGTVYRIDLERKSH
ncbi:MAG: ribonuclease, partial [Saprospiraceae bacterium]|nr:ribonuclease [Saprospiraceae bacterium]